MQKVKFVGHFCYQTCFIGISCLLPESENMEVFKNNLFNKIDMVTSENKRWDMKDPDLPTRSGKVPNITKFDAGCFGMYI